MIVGEIPSAGEKAHERPAAAGRDVADRSPKDRIAALEGVEDSPLRRRGGDSELHLPIDLSECPEMSGQHDADHGRVWTSTDKTAGKSRTIGAQLSPESLEAYTCPPVVPK